MLDILTTEEDIMADTLTILPDTIIQFSLCKDDDDAFPSTELSIGREGATQALRSLISAYLGLGGSQPDREVNRLGGIVAVLTEKAAAHDFFLRENSDLYDEQEHDYFRRRAALMTIQWKRAQFLVEFLTANDAILADTVVPVDECVDDLFSEGVDRNALNLFTEFLLNLESYIFEIHIPRVHGHSPMA